MTIKKLSLSVAATALVASAAFAGSVSNSGSAGLIGSEALSLNDLNISKVFKGLTYTPSDIPATSLKNPIFKFTFGNAKTITVNDSNVSVFQGPIDNNDSNLSVGNWNQIAINPQTSGTNTEVISFNAATSSTYAYNSKKYIVADSNGTDLLDANITAIVVKGSTSDVTLAAALYSGDSQALADSAPTTSIAKVGPEYVGSVTQKYNARIDASNSFYTFFDRNSDGATKKADDAKFNLHQNATLNGASLGVTGATLDLTFDQNLTKNSYTSSAGTANDTNVTDTIGGIFNTSNTAADHNETITLTVNGTSAINKTIFDAHAYVTKSGKSFDLISKTTENAGAWTIYGYNAQIPNVVSITGKFGTTMKFTNRSSLDTNIYFTLIDRDGTVEKLNSKDNTGLASLPANTTGTYKASELFALITDPAFDKSGSVSVEVSIPTTPSSVYGFASFKNFTLDQFKDLPVYNSGMTY